MFGASKERCSYVTLQYVLSQFKSPTIQDYIHIMPRVQHWKRMTLFQTPRFTELTRVKTGIDVPVNSGNWNCVMYIIMVPSEGIALVIYWKLGIT